MCSGLVGRWLELVVLDGLKTLLIGWKMYVVLEVEVRWVLEVSGVGGWWVVCRWRWWDRIWLVDRGVYGVKSVGIEALLVKWVMLALIW